MDEEWTVTVVPDEECPECGGPGSPKVADADGVWHWKCKGDPNCSIGYWVPGTDQVEYKPSPEERVERDARIKAEVDAMMVGRHWEETVVAPGITWFKLVSD